MPVEIDPDLIAQLRLLSKPDRRRVGVAIEAVRANWGQPHLHGVQNVDGSLCFHFIGSHDEVQKFLRSHV